MKGTAESGAGAVQSAGRSVASVARSAKTPLLAGGAALAGLAGAVIVRSRSNHRAGPLAGLGKTLSSGFGSGGSSLAKLPGRDGGLKDGLRKLSRNVSKAAKQADQIGQRVSQTANAVQQVSDTAEGAAKKL